MLLCPTANVELGLNPLSMHFSQIKVSDLILVDEEGVVVEGDEPINAAAFAIHSVRINAKNSRKSLHGYSNRF